MADSLTVADVLARKAGTLELTLLTGPATAESRITTADVASPGLVLAGYVERFTHTRAQVLAETEVRYLESLEPSVRDEAIRRFLSYELPVVFVTKGLAPPAGLVEQADARGIPVVSTAMKTGRFYTAIQSFLEYHFAPSTMIHG